MGVKVEEVVHRRLVGSSMVDLSNDIRVQDAARYLTGLITTRNASLGRGIAWLTRRGWQNMPSHKRGIQYPGIAAGTKGSAHLERDFTV